MAKFFLRNNGSGNPVPIGGIMPLVYPESLGYTREEQIRTSVLEERKSHYIVTSFGQLNFRISLFFLSNPDLPCWVGLL